MALRFGYVGCGFVAQGVHIPDFAGIPEVELVALAEIRPQLGEQVQRRWGFRKLYRSHAELAKDPEVEAVGVSASFSEQAAIACDLLRAGKHVFMEKPMTVSIAEGEEILQAAEASGAKLMVAYMKRYDAGNELAKRTMDEFRAGGKMGGPFYARNHGFCGRNWTAGFEPDIIKTDEPYPQPRPTRYPEWLPEALHQPYVNYLQQYTHNVNLLRWFLEAGDAVRVTGVNLDADAYTGVVTFDMNGVRAIVESGSTSHFGWEEHTQVYFKHGWVKVTSPPLLQKNRPAEVEVYHSGEGEQIAYPLPPGLYTWSYKREAEHFVHALQRGEEFRSGGRDTLTDVRLFEEVFREVLKRSG
jgi:predicted dehydrogenase